MNTQKLFHVLVLGGAMLSGSPLALGDTPSGEVAENPSCVSAPSADEGQAPFDEELKPAFCNQPGACVAGPGGKKIVKEGFFCCWNTTCE